MQSILPKIQTKSVLLFTIVFTLVIGVAFQFHTAYAAAGINQQINFQGKLVDNSGLNVSNGSRTVVFTIYDKSSGGTALWSESQSVTTTDGIFSVQLGSSTPIPSTFNFNWDGLYLGIKVGSDSEMSPRIRLAAVPYAFNAQKVAGLTVQDTSGNASTSGTLQIANNKTVSFGDAFTTSANALTLTTTSTTNVTLPTTGTLATLLGSETFNNKTIGSAGLIFSGASTDITTGSNEDLMLVANGTGLINLNDNVTLGGYATISASLAVGYSSVNPGTGNGVFSGNVGIGTTAPSSAIDVFSTNPTLTFRNAGGTNLADTGVILFTETSTPAGIKLRYDGSTGTGGGTFNITDISSGVNTDLVSVMRNGNVGIGTASPIQKLSLQDGQIFMGTTGVSQFESGRIRFSEETNSFLGAYLHYDGAANNFNIGIHNTQDQTVGNDTNILIINRNSGNVGIGTTTLTSLFNVNGGIRAAGAITGLTGITLASGGLNVGGTVGTGSQCLLGGSTAAWGTCGTSSQWTTASSNIYYNTGNVGIGITNPFGLLNVDGKATGKALAIFNQNGGNQAVLTASVSGVTKFVVDSAGNVGIGTTNASYSLMVNPSGGTAATTSFFQDGTASTGKTKVVIKAGAGQNADSAIYTTGMLELRNSSDTVVFAAGAAGGSNIYVNTIRPIVGSPLAIQGSFGDAAGADFAIGDFNYNTGQDERRNTSGVAQQLTIPTKFSPASGTGVFNAFEVNSTINQNASATGVSRGVYINPTLTLAADYRPFEIAAYTDNTPNTGTSYGALINAATYAYSSSVSMTGANSLTITGAPIGSTNVTIGTAAGLAIQSGSLTNVTNSFGLLVNAQTGATNNYAAAFLGGNVGIGSTSPASELYVKYFSANSTSTVPVLTLDNPSGGTQTSLSFKTNGTAKGLIAVDSGGAMYLNTAGSGDLYLGYTSLTGTPHGVNFLNGAVTIASSGNIVGSGTLTGLTGVTLASGGINVGGTVGTGTQCLLGGTTAAWGSCGGGSSQWTTASSNIYYNTGNVGIGNTNPAALLEVKGASTGHTLVGIMSDATAYGAIGFASTLTSANYVIASNNSTETLINTPSGIPLRFRVANSDKMVMDASGNFAIGTTTPVAMFNVQGKVTGKALAILDQNGGDQAIFTASKSGVTKFVIDTNGNVGVGTTTPSQLLHLYGAGVNGSNGDSDFRITGTGGTGAGIQLSSTATGGEEWTMFSTNNTASVGGGALAFWNKTDTAYRMVIDGSGNVGIGTTTSFTSLLNVNGGVKVAGAITGATGLTLASGGINLGGTVGTGTQCLLGGATASWGSCGGGSSQWTTASSDIYYSTGNVGIGTTSPESLLHLSSSLNALSDTGALGNYNLVVKNSGGVTGEATGIAFSNTNVAGQVGAAIIFKRMGSNSQGELQFYTKQSTTAGADPVQAMVINSAGNVGVGTTDPSGKLNIDAATSSVSQVRLNSSAGVNVSTPGSGDLWWNGTNLNFYNGTTTKDLLGDILTIIKSSNETVTNSTTLQDDDELTFSAGANQTWVVDYVLQGDVDAAPDIQLAVTAPSGSTCRMSLEDNQSFTNTLDNIGCGVAMIASGNGTSDLYYIKGIITTGATSGNVTVQWTQNSTSANAVTITAGSYMTAYNMTNANLTAVTQSEWVRNNGVITPKGSSVTDLLLGSSATASAKIGFINLASGTPTATLSGNISFNNIAGISNHQINLNDNGSLNFVVSPSGEGGAAAKSALMIAPGGNVGIGSTSPNYKLDVSGDVRIGRSLKTSMDNTNEIDLYDNGMSLKSYYKASFALDNDNNDSTEAFQIVTNGGQSTLMTINQDGGSGTNAQARLGIGTTVTDGVVNVEGKVTGKALVILNQLTNGDQDLLTASQSGTTKFTVKSTGTLVLGDATNGLTFDPTTSNSTIYRGTARPTKTISLQPEYAGGVLTDFYGASTDSSITGSMTTDAETSATNSLRTYYQWNSSQGSMNYYTVAVRVKLPKDFSAWTTTNALQVDYMTESTSTANNTVDARVYLESNSTTAVASSTSNASGTADTWTTLTIDDSVLDDGSAPEWDAADETAVIYLRLGSKSNNSARIGEIKLNYLAAF